MSTEYTKRLLERGYGPLLDRIPELVSQARIALGVNDVACYFRETEKGTFRGAVRTRDFMAATFRDIFTETRFAEMSDFLTDPCPLDQVPCFVAGLEVWSVFRYRLDGDTRVLS